ncbi:hypothetical protein AURDEDRAFT_128267 [Auricularia subglabra TFB-10046 SS5]|nr:hypothetical protein AURDEDRAFT_128267 [Auricularia subglabra TFB-10046 SS5]
MLDADINFVLYDVLPALSDGLNRVEELFLHSGDAPIALAALEALQKPAPCLVRLVLGFSFSDITPEHLSLMGSLFAGQAPRLERLSLNHTDWLKPVIPAFRTVGTVNLEIFPNFQWSPEHMSRCCPRLHNLRITTYDAGIWDDDFVFPATLKTVEIEAPYAPHLLRHFSPTTPCIEAANMDSAGVAGVLFSHLPSGALDVHVHTEPSADCPSLRVTHRASGLARGLQFYTDELAYALPRAADLLGPLGMLDRILALDICALYLTCGDAEIPPQLMLPGLQRLTVSGIQNPAWITVPHRSALRISCAGLQVLQLSALAEQTSIPVADVTHFMGAVLQLCARRAVELVLHGVSLEGDQKRLCPVRPESSIISPMSYATAKSMADKVSLELADTSNPTICPICLCDFAESVSGEFAQHLPRLRVECHMLWDACVSTITLQRTADEIERLRARLATNYKSCPRRNGHHSLCPVDSPTYLHFLLESVSHIVKCALHLGARNAAQRAALATKSFADKQGRWPARVEQLFPRGAQSAVDALLDYCELYVSAGPIDVVSSLLVMARPVVLPLLAEDATRARLIDVICKMLDPVAAGLTSRAPWLKRDGAAMERATTFLSHLATGPGALPRDETQFTAGHEAALLAAVTPVVQRLPETHPLFSWLAAWCANLSSRTATAPPPRVARWAARQDALRRRHHGETKYAHVVRDIVLQALARRVCAGPGCAAAVLQAADGKPFPVCGRCRVPRYCSRACQRRDWRGEGAPGERLVPHRQSCGVLAKIDAHNCARLSLREFEDAYARAAKQFDAMDVVLLNTFVESSGRAFGNVFRPDQIETLPGIRGARNMTEEQLAAAQARHEEFVRSEEFAAFLSQHYGSEPLGDDAQVSERPENADGSPKESAHRA